MPWTPRGALPGQTLSGLDARSRYGVSVPGAWPRDERDTARRAASSSPWGGSYRIKPGDTLLPVGERDAVAFVELDGAGQGAEALDHGPP